MLLALACERRTERPSESIPKLRDAVTPGRFNDRDLVEASGIVQSSKESGIFWAQNDSGNEAVLYAFDSVGSAQARVRVDGARNRDWEAIAIGPCDEGSCIYIGDVGDNNSGRNAVSVWRVREPTSNDTLTAKPARLVLRYADGPRDVESMWVAPDTAVYLLTKRPERNAAGAYRPSRIYRVAPSSWRSGDTATAALFDSLPIVPTRDESRDWITDAALSRRDSAGAVRLAVRTYRDVYVFGVDTSTWRPAGLLGRCSLRDFKERMSGEGMTWLPDGRLMFDAEGRAARLHTGRCP